MAVPGSLDWDWYFDALHIGREQAVLMRGTLISCSMQHVLCIGKLDAPVYDLVSNYTRGLEVMTIY